MGKTGLIIVIVLLSIILLPLALFTQITINWPGNEGAGYGSLFGCIFIIICIVFCASEIRKINVFEEEEKEEAKKKIKKII